MEEHDDESANVTAAITEVEQIPPAYRFAFKEVVEDAIRYVFEIEPAEASTLVDRYFNSGDGPSLFAYHRSPLQIAADLSSTGELSDEEKARYHAYLSRAKDAFGLPERTGSADGRKFDVRSGW